MVFKRKFSELVFFLDLRFTLTVKFFPMVKINYKSKGGARFNTKFDKSHLSVA